MTREVSVSLFGAMSKIIERAVDGGDHAHADDYYYHDNGIGLF